MAIKSVHVRDFSKEIPGSITGDGMEWAFPIINSVGAKGRKSFWQVFVSVVTSLRPDVVVRIDPKFLENKSMGPELWGAINVKSGMVDGVVRQVVPTFVKVGKNIGKKTETNVFCQALRDAYGMYNKQLKKSAIPLNDEASDVVLYPPMLAKLPKPGAKIIGDVFIQRKYNGIRAVAVWSSSKGVVMYSRKRIPYPGLTEIKEWLLPILKGKQIYIDGEIYKHGMNLQDLSGYVRAEARQGIGAQYIVYDCIIPGEDPKYGVRLERLTTLMSNDNGPVMIAPTIKCSFGEVDMYYKQFLSEGYEGAMIRLDAEYKYSYNDLHTDRLLKMKPVLDHEFKVVGWTTGRKGKAVKAIMIECVTEGGQKFAVTPALDMVDRDALAQKMGQLGPGGMVSYFDECVKDRMIIVYYDELSKTGVPQRARTKLEERVD